MAPAARDPVEATSACQRAFNELKALFDGKSRVRQLIFSEQQDRFQIWVGFIDEFMDTRNHPEAETFEELREHMIVLLNAIERNLNRIADLESPIEVSRPKSGWQWPLMPRLGLLRSIDRKPNNPDEFPPVAKKFLEIIEEANTCLIEFTEDLRRRPIINPSHAESIVPTYNLNKDESTQGVISRLLKLHGLIHSRFPKMRDDLRRRFLVSFETRETHSALERVLRESTTMESGTMQVTTGRKETVGILQEPSHSPADTEMAFYLCIADQCATPTTIYESVEEWLHHMESSHQSGWLRQLQQRKWWYCNVDWSEEVTFTTATELERHVRLQHGDLVPSVVLGAMLERNTRLSYLGLDYCPICDESIDTSRLVADDDTRDAFSSEKEKMVMVEHIAGHLKELAFMLIQSLAEEDEDGGDDCQDAGRASHQAHTPRSLSVEWPEKPNVNALSQSDLSEFNYPVLRKMRSLRISRVPSTECSTSSSERTPEKSDQLPRERVPQLSVMPHQRMTWRELGRRMHQSKVENAFDARRFVPRNVIDEMITSTNVQESLSLTLDDGDGQSKSIIDFITSKARIFFAVMVTIMRPKELAIAVKTLYDSRLTDEFLPITQKLVDESCNSNQERQCTDHGRELDALHKEPWDLCTLSNFYDRQWEFLAPIFERSGQVCHLKPMAILPFDYLGNDRKSGSFSNVYEVRIHPAHQRFNNKNLGKSPRMALKEFRMPPPGSPDEQVFLEAFTAEQELMTHTGASDHDFLVRPVAAIHRGESRYLLLPWADGGDLTSFWKAMDGIWPRKPSFILKILEQFQGLSNAILHLHEMGYRHGDVKPNNILWFKDETGVGTLKLGDLGLARHHARPTRSRLNPTKTTLGTLFYEAPEIELDHNAPRSRLYDIWSLGCVFVEFAIWLVFGLDGLRDFYQEFDVSSRFYILDKRRPMETFCLHPGVDKLLDQISNDPLFEEDTALGDLIRTDHPSGAPYQFMRGPSNLTAQSPFTRATAQAVALMLRNINRRAYVDDAYLLPRGDLVRRDDSPNRKRRSRPLSVGFDHLAASGPLKSPVTIPPSFGALTPEDRVTSSQLNAWNFDVDNVFAFELASHLEGDDQQVLSSTKKRPAQQLCKHCSSIDIDDFELRVAYTLSYLRSQASRCILCDLFYKAAISSGMSKTFAVEFARKKWIVVNSADNSPILSIVAPLEDAPLLKASPLDHIQLGFLQPPNPVSSVSMTLVRQWLASCDLRHSCMRSSVDDQLPSCLPTRLLNVGTDQLSNIRLEARAGMNPATRYMALSYARSSNFGKLPKAFQDAILVVRQLGIQYLWIDSLCIIQDSERDREAETNNIANTFSNAYCVLAACSSLSAEDGFLEIEQRSVVPMISHRGKGLFLCEFIDDFKEHVEQSHLGSQGWAFQERILARRTLFFTSKQMYWQCGLSIYSSTLTKSSNIRTELYGSPDFPKSALERFKTPPVTLFKDLFQTFSQLTFNCQSDRPYAINGLEARLHQELKCEGRYGILSGNAEYLGQSLLWRRATTTNLPSINFGQDREVPPSWSWLTHAGEIGYLDIRQGEVEWDPQIVMLPEKACGSLNKFTSGYRLSALAWSFHTKNILEACYDQPGSAGRDTMKCVIVGRSLEADKAPKSRPTESGPILERIRSSNDAQKILQTIQEGELLLQLSQDHGQVSQGAQDPGPAETLSHVRPVEDQSQDELNEQRYLIRQLRTMPEADALQALARLREAPPELSSSEALSSALSSGLGLIRPSALRANRSLLPHMLSSIESELLLLHPNLYPPIEPFAAGSINVDHWFMPMGRTCTSSVSDTHGRGSPQAQGKAIKPGPDLASVPDDSSNELSSSIFGLSQFEQLCDTRLSMTKMDYWTKVPIDNRLASRVFSHFFTVHYPIFACFDAELFIEDLVRGKEDNCSKLLVAGIMSIACQSFSAFDVRCSRFSVLFEEEGERLWRDAQHDNSPNKLAAICYLAMASGMSGHEDLALLLHADVRTMAKKLNLFGVQPTDQTVEEFYQLPPKRFRSLAAAAWGSYNWLTFHAFHYPAPPIVFPPTLPIPGDLDRRSGKRIWPPHPLPEYVGQTFTHMCKLWILSQDIRDVYTLEGLVSRKQWQSLGAAEISYQKLLAWSHELSKQMQRNEHSASHLYFFHAIYHIIILRLLQPYLNSSTDKQFSSFRSKDAKASLIYAASMRQLKRILVLYSTKCGRNSDNGWFMAAVLQITSVILRAPEDPDWRIYFQLCFNFWREAYVRYRVYLKVAEANLSFAIQLGAIRSKTAVAMIAELRSVGHHHERPENAYLTAIVEYKEAPEEISSSKMDVMANKFRTLTVD
ncbi:Serine/threonine-protein kinase Nek1 [Paramyrothecium foliicola]|nr:Serine/threonine-protein kinase Nek1 [Paramyrothecium foliicola]